MKLIKQFTDLNKAIKCFEEIVLEHQDSFYSVEARKNYRTLRGDFKNAE